jgi:hypothetical protein
LISASGCAASLGRVTGFELVPERRRDGSVVLRIVVLGPVERLRRLVRRRVAAALR